MKKELNRDFYRYVLPSMISMLLSGFYSMVDGIFVGNAVGSQALAAINLVYPVQACMNATAFGLGVGGAVFVTVAAVYFKLDGQLPDRPGLDGLGKAGVLSQFQRRQTEELHPRPEALGPVDGQQLKIWIGHGHQMLFFHKLLI